MALPVLVHLTSGQTPNAVHNQNTVTVAIPATGAGNDLLAVCCLAIDDTTGETVSTVTGAAFAPIPGAAKTFSTGISDFNRVEIWRAPAVAAGVISVAVTVTPGNSGSIFSAFICEYSGVAGIGLLGVGGANSTNPTVSVPVSYPNSIVLAGFACEENGAFLPYTTALAGTFEAATLIHDGLYNIGVVGGVIDTPVVTPAPTTCTMQQNSFPWAAVAVELRSVSLSRVPLLGGGVL